MWATATAATQIIRQLLWLTPLRPRHLPHNMHNPHARNGGMGTSRSALALCSCGCVGAGGPYANLQAVPALCRGVSVSSDFKKKE